MCAVIESVYLLTASTRTRKSKKKEDIEWKKGKAVQTSPVTQGLSLKLMSDFIFLFRFTSYGSEIEKVQKYLS